MVRPQGPPSRPRVHASPGTPGHVSPQTGELREQVVAELPLQSRVVQQDEKGVVDVGLALARLVVQLQSFLPAPVCPVGLLADLLHQVTEVLVHGGAAFVHHLPLDVRQLREPAAHRTVAGELRDRRVHPRVRVQLPELVDPHQVEGVYALSSAWVCGVVGVQELPVVVDDGACCRGAVGVGVAVLLVRGEVHVREKFPDGVVDIVCPAEQADGSQLLRGVPGLLHGLHPDLLLRLCDGPEGGVRPCVPVPVGAQHIVHPKDRAVLLPELILAVAGAGGPVHQPGHLIGGGVHGLDVQPLGHPAGHRRILVRCHGPVRGDDPAQAGRITGVGVGGVAAHPVVQQSCHPFPGAWFRVVRVQGQQISGRHGFRLPLSAVQGTADESTSGFLCPVSLLLAHGPVLPRGLPGP